MTSLSELTPHARTLAAHSLRAVISHVDDMTDDAGDDATREGQHVIAQQLSDVAAYLMGNPGGRLSANHFALAAEHVERVAQHLKTVAAWMQRQAGAR